VTDSVGTVIDYANLVRNNEAGGVLVQGGSDTTVGATQTSRYEFRYYRTIDLEIPFRGNTIAGNDGHGVTIQNPANPATPNAIATRVNVVANVIEENTGNGVVVEGDRVSGLTIGRRSSVGRPDRTGNKILNNQTGGVTIDAAQAITLIGNEIIGNGTAGTRQIQLLNDANGGIAAPALDSVTARVRGQRMPQYDIRGSVSGAVGQRYYVDFYGNRAVDSRQIYLGRVQATVRSGGIGTFRYLARASTSETGGVDSISATATLATTLLGSTSEFSDSVIPN